MVDQVEIECEDWVKSVLIHDCKVNMKLDTGAQVNILNAASFTRIKSKPVLKHAKVAMEAKQWK